MNLRIIIQARARIEVLEAVVWHEEQLTNLGQQFLLDLKQSVSFIKSNPHSVRLIGGKYRELLMNRFPYVVIYRIDSGANAAVILSVFHLKRDPKTKPR